MTVEHKTPSDYFPAPRIDFSTYHGEGEAPIPSNLLVSPTGNGEEHQDWSFLQKIFPEQSATDIYTTFPDEGLVVGDPPRQDSGISSSWIQEYPANDLRQDSLVLGP